MPMNKITVRDSNKDFHTFQGEDIRYSREGNVYDVYQYTEIDGETRRRNMASFTAPIWVKDGPAKESKPAPEKAGYDITQDDIPTDFRASRTEDHLDPFTARALHGRDKESKPDYNSLAPHTPIVHVKSERADANNHKELAAMTEAEKVNLDLRTFGTGVMDEDGKHVPLETFATASDSVFDGGAIRDAMEAIGDKRTLEDYGPVIKDHAPVQELFENLKSKYGTAPNNLVQNLVEANAETVKEMEAADRPVSPPQLAMDMADSVMQDDPKPKDVIAAAEERHQKLLKKK